MKFADGVDQEYETAVASAIVVEQAVDHAVVRELSEELNDKTQRLTVAEQRIQRQEERIMALQRQLYEEMKKSNPNANLHEQISMESDVMQQVEASVEREERLTALSNNAEGCEPAYKRFAEDMTILCLRLDAQLESMGIEDRMSVQVVTYFTSKFNSF